MARLLFIGIGFLACAGCSLADQIQMQNGDRYLGRVMAMTNDAVVLQNEYLGVVRLPRSKVAQINLDHGQAGAAVQTPTISQPASAAISSNSTPALALNLGGSSLSSNIVQQVQKQFLGDAGPEANEKFNQMVGDLMSGKMSMTDLRAQAKTAADQIRALEKDGGSDAGMMLDSYLGILDHFLKETDTPAVVTTNYAAPPSKAAPQQRR